MFKRTIALLLCLSLWSLCSLSLAADSLSAAVKAEVLAALEQYHTALAGGDVRAIAGFFSENYSNSAGLNKAMIMPFLTDPGVLATMQGQTTDMDDTTMNIDNNVVTVTPITYHTSTGPATTWTYRLKQEDDGVWRLINSEQQ